MKKYLLIDKNTMSRESLSAIIYDLENDAIVHEYESLNQIHDSANAHHDADFIVYNATCEYAQGTNYFEKLQKIAPKYQFLLIIKSTDLIDIEALPDQVAAVTTVNSPRNEIIAAIRSMKIGRRYIGQHVQKYFESCTTQPDQGQFPPMKYRFANEIRNKLTPRQCEVLDYMVKGYANKLIAYELGVSEGTIKLHVSSILRALKVTNRTEAAMRAGQYLTSHAH